MNSNENSCYAIILFEAMSHFSFVLTFCNPCANEPSYTWHCSSKIAMHVVSCTNLEVYGMV